MSTKNEEAQNILPQSLGKLEIVPSLLIPSTSKDQEHHVPSVNLNPFLLRNNVQEISSIEREKLFGPSCNCSQTTNRTASATTNKELSVKRCTQFKPRKRHEFILKQPMLKTYARCLHHHCQKEMKNTLSGNECHSIEKQTSITEPSYDDGAKCNWSLRNEFDVDFKSLNLSENEPCTSSCDLHKSYSFRHPRSEKLRTMYEESSPESTPNDRTNQQNISCSQQAVQAMRSPSSNGDVTTDELACYFETIVHIPKKMSTMAEMMYI